MHLYRLFTLEEMSLFRKSGIFRPTCHKGIKLALQIDTCFDLFKYNYYKTAYIVKLKPYYVQNLQILSENNQYFVTTHQSLDYSYVKTRFLLKPSHEDQNIINAIIVDFDHIEDIEEDYPEDKTYEDLSDIQKVELMEQIVNKELPNY